MNDKVRLRTPEAERYLDLPTGALAKMRCNGTGPVFCRLSPRRIVYTTAAVDAFMLKNEHSRTSEYAVA
jgi:hypothetical protein